ncbi:hypothetical protein BFC17_10235 [Alteromonas lipolytica]|uniref:Porin domain-containing protein n=1 Tax=Alteromonas lipolytica TaxID=1856405 RepID=A0A1E8FJJ3_9ALTE|nr:hypothetical protein BFC17_10235 [Alteromonas lipolytica]
MAASAACCSAPSVTWANSDSDFQISGFGRLVAGYLDTGDAAYLDYSDKVTFDSQSLAALQVDWQVIDKVSVTAQLLAHSNDAKDSGIEWLYLTYHINDDWQLRVGKQRTPFFNYSDVRNVGFAYHWINLPQQLYNGVLFPTYEGINLNYRFGNDEIQGSVETYWGSYNDSYEIAETQIKPDVSNLHGIIGRLQRQNLRFSLAFHRGDIDVALDELTAFSNILRSAGYGVSADSLSPVGKVEVLTTSLGYHSFDYFAEAEIMKLAGEPTAFPDMIGGYISAGIYSPPMTYHVTLASSSVTYDKPVNEIPLGLSPELDQLYYGYDSVYQRFKRDSLNSLAVGVRYDFSANFALKADVSLLRGQGKQRAFFEVKNEQFDNTATLYQLAVEWVF